MANVNGMIVAELKRRRAKLEGEIAGINATMALFSTSNNTGGKGVNKAASDKMKKVWAKRREKAAAAKAASLTEAAEEAEA